MKKLLLGMFIIFIILMVNSNKAIEASHSDVGSNKTTQSGSFIEREEGAYQKTPLLPMLECRYYNESDFKSSYKEITSEAYSAEVADSVKGGVLPHHLVAAPMIAGFFKTIEKAHPETIIVLAPNHKRLGDRPLHTGSFAWGTPFGQLRADEVIAEKLVKSFNAGVNADLLQAEHSISALIPYIHYTFPNVKIVPVLIHGNMKLKDCKALAEFFAETASEKRCMFLASVDFSHGLSPQEALDNDKSTRLVMKSRDYEKLFSLDNAYLDAPPTLATFLIVMDKLAAIDEKLLENHEASAFLQRYVPDTTSYMTYAFLQPESR